MKFAELLERAEAWDKVNYDNLAPVGTMSYKSENESLNFYPKGENDQLVTGLFGGSISLGSRLTSVEMTDNARSQLASRLQAPPQSWLFDNHKCPPALREGILNWKFGNAPDPEKLFLIRQRKLEEGTIARAILSERYEKFDHFEALQMIEQAIRQDGLDPNTTFEIERVYLDDRMSFYLTFPMDLDSGLANFGKGFGGTEPKEGNGHGGLRRAVWFSNDETGGGSWRVHPAIYRQVCTNGLMAWDQDQSVGVAVRHLTTKNAMRTVVADAITQAFGMTQELAEQFVATQIVKVNRKTMKDMITSWVAPYQIPASVRDAWIEKFEERDSTLWDHINYATFEAQRQPQATTEAMERLAGQLVTKGIAPRFMSRQFADFADVGR